MTLPILAVDERRARDAFDVHCALLKAERDDPRLKRNAQWTLLRQDAYEAFSAAFTVLA